MRKKNSGFELNPLVTVVICLAICIAITLFIVQANTTAVNTAPNYTTDSGLIKAIKNLNIGTYSTTTAPSP